MVLILKRGPGSLIFHILLDMITFTNELICLQACNLAFAYIEMCITYCYATLMYMLTITRGGLVSKYTAYSLLGHMSTATEGNRSNKGRAETVTPHIPYFQIHMVQLCFICCCSPVGWHYCDIRQTILITLPRPGDTERSRCIAVYFPLITDERHR